VGVQVTHNVAGTDDADQHARGILDKQVVDAQRQQTFYHLRGQRLGARAGPASLPSTRSTTSGQESAEGEALQADAPCKTVCRTPRSRRLQSGKKAVASTRRREL
jgi:hypothetical protein